MLFKKFRIRLHTWKIIDDTVNNNYTIKIRSGIGMDCDRNSDAKAKAKISNMVVNGKIDKNDVNTICESYMQLRESIVMGHGGMARWVRK